MRAVAFQAVSTARLDRAVPAHAFAGYRISWHRRRCRVLPERGGEQLPFTIAKARSACHKSINIIDLLNRFIPEIEIIKIELLDAEYVYPEYLYHAINEISESAIELVLRRRPNLEPEPTVFAEPPIPELVSEGLNLRANSGQNADVDFPANRAA